MAGMERAGADLVFLAPDGVHDSVDHGELAADAD